MKADFALVGSDSNTVMRVAAQLRRKGMSVHTEFSGSIRKQLRRAGDHSHNVFNLDNADELSAIDTA